jgi:hypothetical protein
MDIKSKINDERKMINSESNKNSENDLASKTQTELEHLTKQSMENFLSIETNSKSWHSSFCHCIELISFLDGLSLANYELLAKTCKKALELIEYFKVPEKNVKFVRALLKVPDFTKLFQKNFLCEMFTSNLIRNDQNKIDDVLMLLTIYYFLVLAAKEVLEFEPSFRNRFGVSDFCSFINGSLKTFESLIEMPLITSEKQAQTLYLLVQKILHEILLENEHFKETPEEVKKKEILAKTPHILNSKSIYKEYQNSGENIKTIPIFPITRDLSMEHNVLLNPLTTESSFENCREYCEAHFRLIREDFIHTLREGFQLYQEQLRLNKLIPNFNVSIFENLRVVR